MSELKEVSGHLLEIGDHVRMDISVIGDGDLDGVEVTASGTNYWRYMCQHPNEVYTVEEYSFPSEDEMGYRLSGPMAGNDWYADELILVSEPASQFEAIKNMTDTEMAAMLAGLLGKDADEMLAWLESEPN